MALYSTTRLKDISAATGFSINTVSKALKDSPSISEPTKALIREKAREAGYVGNGIAGALRSGVTKTIAVIYGDISNPYFSINIKEIEHRVRSNGYSTFILNTDEDAALEYDAIVSVLSKNVDGVIICPSQRNTDSVALLKRSGVPFVLIGRRFRDIETDYVVCDDRQGGYLATDHLLQLGHRRIAFFGGPAFVSSTQERLRGYQEALFARDVPYDPSVIFEFPLLRDGLRDDMAERISQAAGCTAIFAFSDIIALEAIACLQKHGRLVPDDVSVVGFDNIQSKFAFPFPLTSIRASKKSMSIYASDILLEKMRAEKKRPQAQECDPPDLPNPAERQSPPDMQNAPDMQSPQDMQNAPDMQSPPDRQNAHDQKAEYRQIVIPVSLAERGSSREIRNK